jgi:hypothetical protein
VEGGPVPGLTDQPAAHQVGGAQVPQDGHQHQLLLHPGLAIKKNLPKSSVADLGPGSGAFLTPGSGMGKKSGSGSGTNNPIIFPRA